ncbi:uncharacterized protein EMH_0020300 [Eimeria mitis]|uniref:Uncharacterized protein n=1 Tax=Eimeria mitis TaxID=44415 RepID=U6KM67_9EIME|nr:uncharacterized protein EMH_0020300 [Eimeria mitis]CDJ36553.1 hypothetical protein, conserved [Eimeria mitis]
MRHTTEKRQSDAARRCEDDLYEVEYCAEKEIFAAFLSGSQTHDEEQPELDSAHSTDVGNNDPADDERDNDAAETELREQQQQSETRQHQQLQPAQERWPLQQLQQEGQQQWQLQQQDQQRLLQQPQQQQLLHCQALSGSPLVSDSIITWPRRPPSTASRKYLKFVKRMYKWQKHRFLQEHSMEEFKVLKAQVKRSSKNK